MRNFRKAAGLGLLISLLGGCAAPPRSASALTPVSADDKPQALPLAMPDIRNEYRLGPDDKMRIDVFAVKELSLKETRVNSNGEITLPLLGSVRVAGLTANEVEELLRNKLGERYLQNPQVSVSVEEFISQRVVVDGAVKKPGVYPLTGKMTLLQLFAVADGPADTADTHSVRLFRTNANGQKDSLFYDIDAIRKGEVKDPVLQGNDVVEVDKDTLKVVWKNFIETFRIYGTNVAVGR